MNTNKGKKFPPQPLSTDEVRRMLRSCGRGKTSVRNRAIITVMWRTGLRCNEVLDLRPSDCDRGRGTILVRSGKGAKSRTVGADSGTFDAIEAWYKIRPTSAYLFCTLDGTRVQNQYVRIMVPRVAKRAGIEKRVHAHGLRHTHASELRREGVEIGVISKQLGHTSIATTARYLDHVEPTAVRDAIASRKGWAA